MEFTPVNIQECLALCLAFRKDAHYVSFGDVSDFDEVATVEWFKRLTTFADAGFYHVMLKGEIIGQIEFRKRLVDRNHVKYGYINLFYLIPQYRNQGLGEQLEAFIMAQFKANQCEYAMLRYLPENGQGKAFYRKQGWVDVGECDEFGQLAQKRLNPTEAL